MSNFKIIAIKTGKKTYPVPVEPKTGIKLDFFKVLKENTIYQLYQQYTFVKENSFDEIIYKKELEIDLYNLKSSKLKININAIVGENGSGKSTLIELLYVANYNIGCILGLFEEPEQYKLYAFLDLEIFYSTEENVFFKLQFQGGKIFKQEYTCLFKNSKYRITPTSKNTINHTEDLSNFFYSVVINYSHYALNTSEIGNWIHPLFHKNDGYQTPLVLNPKREKGNIDINIQKKLLTRRLQANLLEKTTNEPVDSLRNLANGKIAEYLKISYNSFYEPDLQIPRGPEDARIAADIFTAIADKTIFNCKISNKDRNSNFFIEVTTNYLISKLKKIAHKYKPFFKYQHGEDSIKDIRNFIIQIKESDSHIVFKAKGAILYMKYFYEIFSEVQFSSTKSMLFSIDSLSKIIASIDKKETKFWVNTFMMSPPSFFNVEIIPEKNLPFDSMSSGEKQKIHSVSSIVYHLINLNSVQEEKSKKNEKFIKYDYVNIILDEIELYYHPEWQRRYINDLLDYISKIDSKNLEHIKGINITFLTHSPFILSDIPSSNILKIDKGNPKLYNPNDQTFGANVHDLLAHDFYMNNGFMGEWAKKKIEEIIRFLNVKNLNLERDSIIEKIATYSKTPTATERKDKEKFEKKLNWINAEIEVLKNTLTHIEPDYCLKIIELIGEPIVRHKLLIMYDEIFGNQQKSAAREEILLLAQKAGLKIDIKP